ncbi:MAG: hypothetical protein AAF745_05770 [Planctomycetota bacterium]
MIHWLLILIVWTMAWLAASCPRAIVASEAKVMHLNSTPADHVDPWRAADNIGEIHFQFDRAFEDDADVLVVRASDHALVAKLNLNKVDRDALTLAGDTMIGDTTTFDSGKGDGAVLSQATWKWEPAALEPGVYEVQIEKSSTTPLRWNRWWARDRDMDSGSAETTSNVDQANLASRSRWTIVVLPTVDERIFDRSTDRPSILTRVHEPRLEAASRLARSANASASILTPSSVFGIERIVPDRLVSWRRSPRERALTDDSLTKNRILSALQDHLEWLAGSSDGSSNSGIILSGPAGGSDLTEQWIRVASSFAAAANHQVVLQPVDTKSPLDVLTDWQGFAASEPTCHGIFLDVDAWSETDRLMDSDQTATEVDQPLLINHINQLIESESDSSFQWYLASSDIASWSALSDQKLVRWVESRQRSPMGSLASHFPVPRSRRGSSKHDPIPAGVWIGHQLSRCDQAPSIDLLEKTSVGSTEDGLTSDEIHQDLLGSVERFFAADDSNGVISPMIVIDAHLCRHEILSTDFKLLQWLHALNNDESIDIKRRVALGNTMVTGLEIRHPNQIQMVWCNRSPWTQTIHTDFIGSSAPAVDVAKGTGPLSPASPQIDGRRWSVEIASGEVLLCQTSDDSARIDHVESELTGGSDSIESIKSDVTLVIERLGMLGEIRRLASAMGHDDLLRNGNFDAPIALAGWMHAQHPADAVTLVPVENGDTDQCVRMAGVTQSGSQSWLISETLPTPQTGRLAVSLRARSRLTQQLSLDDQSAASNMAMETDFDSSDVTSAKIRIAIEGHRDGKPFRHTQFVKVPQDGQWHRIHAALQCLGLDSDCYGDLKLAIDNVSPAPVWLDQVHVTDWFATAAERSDLQSLAFLAIQGFRNAEGFQKSDWTPTARLLQNFWAKQLLTFEAPPVVDADAPFTPQSLIGMGPQDGRLVGDSSALNAASSTQTRSKTGSFEQGRSAWPRATSDESPPSIGMTDRLRRWLPSPLRF